MNVLAFDTCLGAVSVAVRARGPGGELKVHEVGEVRATGHAERLFPMLSAMMEKSGLSFAALDRIAVTVGPGSFTGVRIGIATARGLALAAGKPVVAATSLAVMAERAQELLAEAGEALGPRSLMAAVDARRGGLYVQSFADNGEAPLRATSDALVLTAQEAAHRIGRSGAIVVGSGAAAVTALLQQAGVAVELRFPDLQPHARCLAGMAPHLVPVHPVRPLYLRMPDVRPQEGAALARATAS
ncbi:MAG TPA: tRNA (adenosine(37)-N6)-threonylcarbamoyltransferase complex dimerization subunit type 1 TsaB [Hyphomicrobiaceae bacterium]|nr:tRNA (adenosine(37)-N6)-threonylcarbamoyltransferase complex dimerization subunit type 1 TsaB [Hyphomicrobiaceae bacterium]